MLLQTSASLYPPGLPRDANPYPNTPKWPGMGLPLESAWRNMFEVNKAECGSGTVFASRWVDASSHSRHATTVTPADRHVLAIALRRTRVCLTAGRRELFKGPMAAGTVQLTGPNQALSVEFNAPCDFIHLYLPPNFAFLEDAEVGLSDPGGCILRDPLASQLARSLTDTSLAGQPRYAESIARTLLLRLAAQQASSQSVCPLPRWRLNRVNNFVEENLSEAVSLTDMARAAGLSRSYFAAQFRATTGYRPHDYLVEQRIESAKAILAKNETPLVEVALAVGFQTQAHFSTVFKRLTGTTPGRWRLAQLDRN